MEIFGLTLSFSLQLLSQKTHPLCSALEINKYSIGLTPYYTWPLMVQGPVLPHSPFLIFPLTIPVLLEEGENCDISIYYKGSVTDKAKLTKISFKLQDTIYIFYLCSAHMPCLGHLGQAMKKITILDSQIFLGLRNPSLYTCFYSLQLGKKSSCPP